MEQKRRPSPSSDTVLELARSYQGAAVLCAAAELDVFSRLSGNGSTASSLAAELGCSPRGISCLLNALAAVDLLDKEGERFSLKPGLGNLLGREGAASICMMLRHQANCMRRWSQLAMSVKRGSPAPCLESVGGPQGDLESFIGAMDNVSAPVASEVVKSLSTIEFSRLLDIGGASGTWTIALLAMKPAARATLFDLPEVLPLAKSRLTAAGLTERVELAPGNFYTDELPRGPRQGL